MNNRIKFLFCALLLGITAWLYGNEVIEAIVAVVNDDIITLSEFKQQKEELMQMLQTRVQGEEFTKQYEKLKSGLLDSMITDILLLQEAKKKNLDVTEQVKMTIENIKKENGFETDEQLRRAMQQQGIDFDVWNHQMQQNFLKQNLIFTEVSRSIVIDDSEIINYYKQHNEEFTEPQEFKLRAIYLSDEGKTEEELQQKMKEIDEKIAAGSDLAVLAGEYSEGPGKESQGDLGNFKQGEMDKSLEQAVEKLNTGELSPWLKTKKGWYLIRLEEKKESRLKTFEEVRKEIEEKLFQEQREKKLQEFLEQLKERSYIKILIPDPFSMG